jgi:hypothetical protein
VKPMSVPMGPQGCVALVTGVVEDEEEGEELVVFALGAEDVVLATLVAEARAAERDETVTAESARQAVFALLTAMVPPTPPPTAAATMTTTMATRRKKTVAARPQILRPTWLSFSMGCAA